jgi:hypothetical protein
VKHSLNYIILCLLPYLSTGQSKTDTSNKTISLLGDTIKGCCRIWVKPKTWGFIRNVPDDIYKIAKSPFERKNLLGLTMVAGSTALLIWQDQPLLEAAKKFGSNIHLHPETDYKVLIKVGTTKILKVPRNINTALYQLGEGGSSMLVAAGFFAYGKFGNNNRALQTASDLAETFLAMGAVTQILKRSTGRQSPFMSTKAGGKWQPFPSIAEYQRNTSNYDAFPSGHLATLMATVTVVSLNYPEKKWIQPAGYVLIGLVSFAMMNTDVHWAGDYPLALALGYLNGKITSARNKKRNATNNFF